jgi:hypothetical protein
MEINDLHKLILKDQEIEHPTANGREVTRILGNPVRWQRDRSDRMLGAPPNTSCRFPSFFGRVANRAPPLPRSPSIAILSADPLNIPKNQASISLKEVSVRCKKGGRNKY